VPKLVDEYMDGQLKIDEFVTHEFGFQDINKAFDVARDGGAIRCIVNVQQ
jgi:S-(hydroxymethyl)glutathione dehydrogenase/alcohol dehydrogenase